MMARFMWDMARESQYVPPPYDNQIWQNPENQQNVGRGRGVGEAGNNRGRGNARGRGMGGQGFPGGRGHGHNN